MVTVKIDYKWEINMDETELWDTALNLSFETVYFFSCFLDEFPVVFLNVHCNFQINEYMKIIKLTKILRL